MANTQVKRVFYTDATLTSSNPTVDEGVIIDVKTITTPNNTTSQTSYAAKTGDGSTAYSSLPFDQEIVMTVTGNVLFSGDFASGQKLVFINNSGSTYTIDFGSGSPKQKIVLQDEKSISVQKVSSAYILTSELPDIILTTTGTGNETVDLTTGYTVGDVIIVKNEKTSGKANIDIDLTDNIPLGEDHSLRLRVESDGIHCEFKQIDKTDISDGSITGVLIVESSGKQKIIIEYSSTTSSSESNTFGSSSGTLYRIDRSYIFESAFASAPYCTSGNNLVSDGRIATHYNLTATTVNVRLYGKTNASAVSGSYVFDGEWTTQTMKG